MNRRHFTFLRAPRLRLLPAQNERRHISNFVAHIGMCSSNLRANARAEIGVAHPAINVLKEAPLRARLKTQTENAPRDYT